MDYEGSVGRIQIHSGGIGRAVASMATEASSSAVATDIDDGESLGFVCVCISFPGL